MIALTHSYRFSLLMGGLLLALSQPASAQWSAGPSLSNARSAPGVVRHGGDIYAVGGFNSPNSLEVLHSGAQSWVALAPLPVGQQGLAAAVVGNRIYTFGSYGWATTCQIYDITTNTWQAGPPVPIGIYWSTAEAVGTNIYLIAGYINPQPTGVIGCDLMFILDTTTNTWTLGPSLPGVIQVPASVTHGQHIYVFGHYSRYYKYDLVAGTWSTFTGPPSGRGHAAEAVSVGNFVYLIGGNSGYIYEAYRKVEVYDPSIDAWMPGPSLITGRYQFGAVYLPNEDRIYAVGGSDNNAQPLAGVEIMTGSFFDLLVTAQTPNHGTVIGSYAMTHVADNVHQQVQEVVVNRRSSLEHEWQIGGVPSTNTRTLYVRAQRTASTDNDVFVFQVRRGNQWVTALTVANTADDGSWQEFVLPANVSGTVRIRVIDSDSTSNATALDSIYVDQMFIRVQ